MKYKIITYLLISAFTSMPQTNITQPEVQEVILEDTEIVEEKAPIVNFKQVDEDVWATTSVNIRSGAGTDFDKISCLQKGDKIRRIGIGDNGWSKVIYNDTECFVNSKYLSTSKPEVVVQEVISNEVEITNSPIKKDGNVNNSFINLASAYYMKMPENIRNYLKKNSVQVYVTDKNIAQTWFAGQYNSVMAVTLAGERAIYIEDRKNACISATIHECGHMIDALNGFLCWQETFANLYISEAGNFKEPGSNKNYAELGPQEYFAELFSQVIQNPTTVQQQVPNSYNYMVNLINSIS